MLKIQILQPGKIGIYVPNRNDWHDPGQGLFQGFESMFPPKLLGRGVGTLIYFHCVGWGRFQHFWKKTRFKTLKIWVFLIKISFFEAKFLQKIDKLGALVKKDQKCVCMCASNLALLKNKP